MNPCIERINRVKQWLNCLFTKRAIYLVPELSIIDSILYTLGLLLRRSSDRSKKHQFPKGSFVFLVIGVWDHQHLYKYIYIWAKLHHFIISLWMEVTAILLSDKRTEAKDQQNICPVLNWYSKKKLILSRHIFCGQSRSSETSKPSLPGNRGQHSS